MYSMALSYTDFIDEAQQIQKERGIPASIILAQLILESGNKFSQLARDFKNLFGTKGEGTAGSVYLPTTEYINGRFESKNAKFAAYESYYDNLLHHAEVLQNPRYTKYTSTAKSIEDYARGLQLGGYATDPNYADKLINIIKSYGLHKYDDNQYSFSGKTGGITSTKFHQNVVSNELSFSASIVRIVIITLVAIFSMIFFLKAFPAVDNLASNTIKTAITKIPTKGGTSQNE